MEAWPVPPLPTDIVPRKIRYAPDDSLARPFVPLASAFRDGSDSVRAYLERCLETIEAAEPSVRAFVVRQDAKVLRDAADAATTRWRDGKPLSAVDGMPIVVKDMIETIDLPTQMNNPIFTGWHARRDAASVMALRGAGALVIGKTVTTEFAVGNSGPARNPYDSNRTPGGSSSGTAAAVGGGMAAFGLGTQTHASTIRPASYCGAYALKASFGALHVGGVTPLTTTLDHLGLFGASLEDLWAGTMVIARRIGGTPPHPGIQGPIGLPDAHKPKALIRLDMQGWSETSEATRAAFEALVDKVAKAGVKIIDRRGDSQVEALEQTLADVYEFALDLLAWEARWPFGTYRDQGPRMVGPRILDLLARAEAMDGARYAEAVRRREALQTQVHALSDRAEGFLTLSASGPAIEDHAFTGSRSYPLPWTLVAGPTFAVPVMAVEDLPLAAQVAGYRERDAELAAIARWVRDQAMAQA
jgi:Asp-tRNA(Asn)/Glu-tRNA(Gln) amidotransferase A subunit family amidase